MKNIERNNSLVMKKSIFLALFSFLVLASFGQRKKDLTPPNVPYDSTTNQIIYQEVVSQEGSQAELFDRAMDWVKAYYKNTTEVINKADKDEGQILCSSRVKIYSTAKGGTKIMSGMVNYKLNIEIKDGRYRYTFDKFALKAQSWSPIEAWLDPTKKEWFPQRYDNLMEVDQQVKEIISSLKEAMVKKEEKIDEW